MRSCAHTTWSWSRQLARSLRQTRGVHCPRRTEREQSVTAPSFTSAGPWPFPDRGWGSRSPQRGLVQCRLQNTTGQLWGSGSEPPTKAKGLLWVLRTSVWPVQWTLQKPTMSSGGFAWAHMGSGGRNDGCDNGCPRGQLERNRGGAIHDESKREQEEKDARGWRDDQRCCRGEWLREAMAEAA